MIQKTFGRETKTTMQLFTLSFCIFLVHQTVWGIHINFERNFDDNSVSIKPQITEKLFQALLFSNESSEIDSSLTDRTEVGNTEYKQVFTTDNTDEANFTLPSSNQSLPSTYSASGFPSTSSTDNMGTSTAVSNNESHSQISTELSSSESSAATNKRIMFSTLPTFSNKRSATMSTTDDDEPEGVVIEKRAITEGVTNTTTKPTGKIWALMGQSGGDVNGITGIFFAIVFVAAVILTITICRVLNRMCSNKRLYWDKMPDSKKNLTPSLGKRLFGESRDEGLEEF